MENKTKTSTLVVEVDHSQVFKLLVVVAALLCLLYVAYILSNKSKERQQVEAPQLAAPEKTNVDFSELPTKFPSNVPIESGAKTTQNFEVKSPDGNFQATRGFETKLSLADNLKLYTDFLKKDGWEIKATVDNKDLKMVIGQKAEKSLQITMNENTITKIKTVTISYAESKLANVK